MRQCFAWWSFSLDPAFDPHKLLQAAPETGVTGVEMLPQELWPVAREAGLSLVNINGHPRLEEGFNDPARHGALQDEVRRSIDLAAENGIEKVLVFTGNRFGDGDDKAAIAACVDGLGPLAETAQKSNVQLLLELMNSKVDHPGYQGDSTDFGVEIIRQVALPSLKLLFDCYHMQLMEGDLSRTIKTHFDLIGHFHTAGVPGRRDLDDRQEINWRGIAGLLHHLSYDGWVGHEFVPRGDPIAALAHAVRQFEAPSQEGSKSHVV